MKKKDRYYYHYDMNDTIYFWNMVYYTCMINKTNRELRKEFENMGWSYFVQMIRAVDTLLCNQKKQIEELKEENESLYESLEAANKNNK